MVLAKKSDGSLRFCVDYRQLNQLTVKDSWPLPRIDACFDALGRATFLSTADLRFGFWQTAMDPQDADKTAFVTRKVLYRFKVLSFGLANAPSMFQRIMDLVLAGLTWECCLVFVDDILVFSSTFDEHVERLGRVFDRLSAAGLKLKPSKCQLFQKRVSFLGHVVSGKGIEPDPAKVSAVTEWPVPRSVTEVRSFVGLASYYRCFLANFSEIAGPLLNLTKKGVPFVWDERCQTAFDRLKLGLVSAPVLALPLDGGGYVIDADCAGSAAGAVLQQWQSGQLRVIAYASRALSAAERNYCVTRKEQLAIVYGLKQFRPYVLENVKKTVVFIKTCKAHN